MSVKVIDLVRAETLALHKQLENRLDVFTRLEQPAERAWLMARFWGFYHPVEEDLARLLRDLPGLEYDARRKTPTLERDLLALGLDSGSLQRFAPPGVDGRAEAMGFQYVLEGSTLGGRVIRKRAADRGLGLTGLSFFDVYGAETGARWRAFLEVLESVCVGRAGDAARGARRGFEAIEAWLCRETMAA